MTMRPIAYRLRNLASRKLLANPGGSRDSGAKIIQWDDSGGPEQAWTLEPVPGGGAQLRNAASGKVLANPQGSRDNGTELIQWDDRGESDQVWTLEPGPNGGMRLRNQAEPEAARRARRLPGEWDGGGAVGGHQRSRAGVDLRPAAGQYAISRPRPARSGRVDGNAPPRTQAARPASGAGTAYLEPASSVSAWAARMNLCSASWRIDLTLNAF